MPNRIPLNITSSCKVGIALYLFYQYVQDKGSRIFRFLDFHRGIDLEGEVEKYPEHLKDACASGLDLAESLKENTV